MMTTMVTMAMMAMKTSPMMLNPTHGSAQRLRATVSLWVLAGVILGLATAAQAYVPRAQRVIDAVADANVSGKRVRALHPWGQDAAWFEVIGRGEFTLNGFRNRDLRRHLFAFESPNPETTRRHSGQVTRRLRLLRAHGLIKKVPRTHRYLLTDKGRAVIVALSAARNASPRQLTELAA